MADTNQQGRASTVNPDAQQGTGSHGAQRQPQSQQGQNSQSQNTPGESTPTQNASNHGAAGQGAAGQSSSSPGTQGPEARRPAAENSSEGPKRSEARTGGGKADGEVDVEEGLARAKSVGAQLVDQVRTAAEALIDEQKERAAHHVSGVADALRQTAKSLDSSEGRSFAQYADQAAEHIESFSDSVRDRSWSEIAADVERFARNQPSLFLVGSVGVGFLLGRFLSASAARRPSPEASAAARAGQKARQRLANSAPPSSSHSGGGGGYAMHGDAPRAGAREVR